MSVDAFSRVRALCEHYDIPLKKLADAAGISHRRIYTISSRDAPPSVGEVAGMSRLFPHHALWIFAGEEISPKIVQEVPRFLMLNDSSDDGTGPGDKN